MKQGKKEENKRNIALFESIVDGETIYCQEESIVDKETIFRFRNERGKDIIIGVTYQKETIVDEETIYKI